MQISAEIQIGMPEITRWRLNKTTAEKRALNKIKRHTHDCKIQKKNGTPNIKVKFCLFFCSLFDVMFAMLCGLVFVLVVWWWIDFIVLTGRTANDKNRTRECFNQFQVCLYDSLYLQAILSIHTHTATHTLPWEREREQERESDRDEKNESTWNWIRSRVECWVCAKSITNTMIHRRKLVHVFLGSSIVSDIESSASISQFWFLSFSLSIYLSLCAGPFFFVSIQVYSIWFSLAAGFCW